MANDSGNGLELHAGNKGLRVTGLHVMIFLATLAIAGAVLYMGDRMERAYEAGLKVQAASNANLVAAVALNSVGNGSEHEHIRRVVALALCWGMLSDIQRKTLQAQSAPPPAHWCPGVYDDWGAVKK